MLEQVLSSARSINGGSMLSLAVDKEQTEPEEEPTDSSTNWGVAPLLSLVTTDLLSVKKNLLSPSDSLNSSTTSVSLGSPAGDEEDKALDSQSTKTPPSITPKSSEDISGNNRRNGGFEGQGSGLGPNCVLQ